MSKKIVFFLMLSLCCFLAACSILPSQNDNPTQTAPQILDNNTYAKNTNINTVTPIVQQSFSSEVSEVEIAIIQHYTLLNYHLYQEAYQFLSQKKSGGQQSFDQWIKIASTITSVKILSVIPYNEYAKKFGYKLIDEKQNFKTFGISLIMYGKDAMVGSVSSGEKQFFFVNMSLDDEEWKIYSFQTDIPR